IHAVTAADATAHLLAGQARVERIYTSGLTGVARLSRELVDALAAAKAALQARTAGNGVIAAGSLAEAGLAELVHALTATQAAGQAGAALPRLLKLQGTWLVGSADAELTEATKATKAAQPTESRLRLAVLRTENAAGRIEWIARVALFAGI